MWMVRPHRMLSHQTWSVFSVPRSRWCRRIVGGDVEVRFRVGSWLGIGLRFGLGLGLGLDLGFVLGLESWLRL